MGLKDFNQIQDEAMSALIRARVSVFDAHESQDLHAALAAINALVAFVEAHPDYKVLAIDSEEKTPVFTMPSTAFQMTARYAGTCSVCSDRIAVGSIMYWDKPKREAICMRCSTKEFF